MFLYCAWLQDHFPRITANVILNSHANCAKVSPGSRPTTRRFRNRKSGDCFMWRSRERAEAKEIKGQVTVRAARPVQLGIGIEEEIAPWLAMSASAHSLNKLSASAVEQYDRCPLQFKLARIWNLPAELPAAVQYGAAIHTALKDYYDALMQGRPRSEEQLLALFWTKFEEYSIPEE